MCAIFASTNAFFSEESFLYITVSVYNLGGFGYDLLNKMEFFSKLDHSQRLPRKVWCGITILYISLSFAFFLWRFIDYFYDMDVSISGYEF
jgi:hypothetical protein